MTIQPITYRGRTVAAATRSRFFLCDALARRPCGDPERTFVIFMCAYAVEVLSGVLPGPYRCAMRTATRAPARSRPNCSNGPSSTSTASPGHSKSPQASCSPQTPNTLRGSTADRLAVSQRSPSSHRCAAAGSPHAPAATSPWTALKDRAAAPHFQAGSPFRAEDKRLASLPREGCGLARREGTSESRCDADAVLLGRAREGVPWERRLAFHDLLMKGRNGLPASLHATGGQR
jgi:hypothetical protein